LNHIIVAVNAEFEYKYHQKKILSMKTSPTQSHLSLRFFSASLTFTLSNLADARLTARAEAGGGCSDALFDPSEDVAEV
jgi:hypothetical protein